MLDGKNKVPHETLQVLKRNVPDAKRKKLKSMINGSTFVEQQMLNESATC